MPLGTPAWRTVLCPFCIQPISSADWHVTPVYEPARKNSRWFRLWSLVGRVGRHPRLANRPQAQIRCPLCSAGLPTNLFYIDNPYIAVVGSAGVPKRRFMKALIGALERGAAESLGAWRFAPLNQNVENMYLDWIRQDVALDELAGADDETAGEVAASNPLPSATPSRLVRPLVYTLFVRRKSVLPSTHRVNLLLHDALGDHLTDMSSVALYQRYLQNAAGIICLINPLTIPPLAERLPGYLQQTVDPGNDARRTINRLIDSIQRDPHRGSADRIQVPCAVAFDPSDLLRFVLPHLGRDAHLLQDSDYATGIPVEDLQQVSQAVQDLLRQLAPSLVSQLQNSFATVAFFATSSGGRNGRGAPRRCLDPLAWLLWQMQVVQPASRRDVDVPPSH